MEINKKRELLQNLLNGEKTIQEVKQIMKSDRHFTAIYNFDLKLNKPVDNAIVKLTESGSDNPTMKLSYDEFLDFKNNGYSIFEIKIC